jgi:ArsR family transcriptional regulator, arsenate/arsenite/antimonite-responsive transcriptional repressor
LNDYSPGSAARQPGPAAPDEDLAEERGVRDLSQIFKALSDETRLTILGLIFRHGHLCVCEVERILGITQSKASRHLRYLRDAGVLEDEREGVIVNYRLPRAPGAELAAVLMLVRGLLAGREVPEAGGLLVQIRALRAAEEVMPAGFGAAPPPAGAAFRGSSG